MDFAGNRGPLAHQVRSEDSRVPATPLVTVLVWFWGLRYACALP